MAVSASNSGGTACNQGGVYTVNVSFTETSYSTSNNSSTLSISANFTNGANRYAGSTNTSLELFWIDDVNNTTPLSLGKKDFTDSRYDENGNNVDWNGGVVRTISSTITVYHNSSGYCNGYARAVYTSPSKSTYRPGSLTVDTANTALTRTVTPTYNVVVRIRNQRADGGYDNSWVWINETKQQGSSVDYIGYQGDVVYNQVRYTNNNITGNIDTTLDASRKTYSIDINAYQPNGSTQNGLKFDMTDSRGNTWTNITNEPSGFTRRYGETATISNIRSNVTGAHYTKNSITGDASGSFSFTFSNTLSLVTLSSAWNTYTIKYNANGGSGAPGNQTKTYGTNLTLSSTKPTRYNYKFLGWSTSSTATSETYKAGSVLSTDLSTTQGATVTLYAVWIPAVMVSINGGAFVQAGIRVSTNGGSFKPVKQRKVI